MARQYIQKKIKYLMILLISCPLYSQENTIYVLYTKDDELFSTYKQELIATNDWAVFWNERIIYKGDNVIHKKEDDVGFSIVNTDLDLFKTEIFLDRSNTIVIRNHKDKEIYDVIDELPKYNWQIHDGQTKTIGGYECTKATCFFRGTPIVAYFSTEIPIQFGPWKFKNLPGLIMELSTLSPTYNTTWRVEQIIYPFKNREFGRDINVPKKRITLKEEIEIEEKNFRESDEQSRAMLPEGVTMEESKRVRIDVEKIYEWEK